MMVLGLLFISCAFAISCKNVKGIHKSHDYVYKKTDADTTVYFNLCGPINTHFENYDSSDTSVLAYLDTYKELVLFGRTSSETLEVVKDGTAVQFSYTGQMISSLEMGSRVIVTCGSDTSSNIQAHLDGSTIVFSFDSPDVCDLDSFPITGLILCIVLFVAICLYIVVMVVLNIFVFHKSGLEIIPNYLFWIGLPSLIVDGVKFTFCCKKAGSEYQSFNV